MLSHPWLELPSNYDTRLTDEEYQTLQEKKKLEKLNA